MGIEQSKLLAVLSEALDSVEKEILGATGHHAKRVAWLCLRMADKLALPENERTELAVSALLHDSALNEYRRDYENGALRTDVSGRGHCAAGEANLRMIPGFRQSREFIKYHHERSDGKEPFGKEEHETPIGAQLIHIADEVDRMFSLHIMTHEKLPEIEEYIETRKGNVFGRDVAETFLHVITEDVAWQLSDDVLACWQPDIAGKELDHALRPIADLFARIIDYKSPFTKEHSIGLAEKAQIMAQHYGWNEKICDEIYCAGALHDIGKLMVSRDVLEKPGKLDQEEYRHIQTHVYETYRLLSKMGGAEKITQWASFHHEKLNGKGYPFGKTAEELDEKARLLACLDIYQALTEDRPYKAGMQHKKAISIMKELAEKGELDSAVIEEIDKVFVRGEEEEAESTLALFQCPVCAHIYEGDVLPENYVCPVCGQPNTAFLRIK